MSQNSPPEKPGRKLFVKGQSGNPGGRPKAVVEVINAARQHTAEAIKTLATICKNADSPESARIAAAVALLDRGWGKPVQPAEVTGKDGGPIRTAPDLSSLTDDQLSILGAITGSAAARAVGDDAGGETRH